MPGRKGKEKRQRSPRLPQARGMARESLARGGNEREVVLEVKQARGSEGFAEHPTGV